jgi:tripartite-type tricarboxylate transporter receptor subunit TctC
MTHLTGELLQQRADIKLLTVPYNGGPATAFADLGSGRVSMTIEGYAGIVGAVKSNAIKLIAVASSERLADFPDLPTVAESIPDFSAAGWQVLAAPVGTPQPILNKVSADLAKVESDTEFKKRLATVGAYPRAMTPEQTLAFVQKEQETWLPLLEKVNGK